MSSSLSRLNCKSLLYSHAIGYMRYAISAAHYFLVSLVSSSAYSPSSWKFKLDWHPLSTTTFHGEKYDKLLQGIYHFWIMYNMNSTTLESIIASTINHSTCAMISRSQNWIARIFPLEQWRSDLSDFFIHKYRTFWLLSVSFPNSSPLNVSF